MSDFNNPVGIRPKSTKLKDKQHLRRAVPIGEAGLNVTRLGYCKGRSRSQIDGSYLDTPRCTKFNDLPQEKKMNVQGIQNPVLKKVRIGNGKYGYNIFNAGL